MQARTAKQAERLAPDRINQAYLPGVELPAALRVEPAGAGLARADYVLLALLSRGMDEVISRLEEDGLPRRGAIVSLAKGLVPPEGVPPEDAPGRALRDRPCRLRRRSRARARDGP